VQIGTSQNDAESLKKPSLNRQMLELRKIKNAAVRSTPEEKTGVEYCGVTLIHNLVGAIHSQQAAF
jgi:hypothetical protein